MYAANKEFGSEMPKKALSLSNGIIGCVAYSLWFGYYVVGEVGSGIRMTTCMQNCNKSYFLGEYQLRGSRLECCCWVLLM